MTYSQYLQLRQKVDDKFGEITSHHPSEITCHLGCHSCCQPNLSVSRVEKDVIKEHLNAHPQIIETLKALTSLDPHKGTRCQMLSKEGACLIYDARPIICRSHGLPIKFKENDQQRRDVCPLNFSKQDISKIEEEDVMNLELVNSILALINQQLYGKEGSQRFPLTLDSFSID